MISGSKKTFGFADDLRVFIQPPGQESNLQTPRVHILESLKPPGSEPILQVLAVVTSGFPNDLMVLA
ncbi:hypothetical protein F2Q70_00038517 [Brassica cretica]|uniref:Uncharacterized protein n=1 Tax=Brassica cretica TaxID=69181 RepID=A0A8S9MRF8_BRACR|nr:hypothetical protein F2Q70_00038517 [Brassica cretica]KAF2620441.1 hypothetical protein F2Q68_00039149 [Brassica cretica]